MAIRMLLIDDEDAVTAALPHTFRRHCGWEIDVERDLTNAERSLSERFYDVIILDIALTGPTIARGVELIGFARGSQPHSRILVFTAFDSALVRSEAVSQGANAVLHKPAAVESVRSAVLDMLAPCVHEGEESP